MNERFYALPEDKRNSIISAGFRVFSQSLFQLKAYYEKDKFLRPEINQLIGNDSGFDNQSEILKLNKEQFIEGIDLEMMYTDMFLASQGYLWEKLQSDTIDPNQMEKDFIRMIEFWRSLYSRRK